MSSCDSLRAIKLVVVICFALASAACAPKFTDGNCQSTEDCFVGEQCLVGVCQVATVQPDMDVEEDMFVAEDMAPDAEVDMAPDMPLVPVDTVRVTPLETTLDLLETVQLTVTILDADGNELTDRTPTFESSLEAVASVDDDGLVTARGEGSATITVSAGDAEATATVSVIKAPVANVILSPSAPSLGVGATVQLTATVEDAAGGELLGREVSWDSDAEGIATVDMMGLVTGVAIGSADIVATVEGVEGRTTVSVVPEPVDSVTVDPTSAQIEVTETVQLAATVLDDEGNELTGRTVTWMSSNENFATVDSNGLVTGEGAGDATVTATSEGEFATAMITVVPRPVDRVDVLPATTTLNPTETLQYTAIPRAADGTALTGRTVMWSSGNMSIATVDASGLVTAQSVGSTMITATVEGEPGSGTLNVVEPVDSVEVTPSSAAVDVGGSTTFTATPKDSAGNVLTGRNCTFSSQVMAVATIDSTTGVATVQSEGDTIITATCEGVPGSATLAGLGPVATVTVTPASATVSFLGTQQFTAELRDSSNHVLTGRTVTWNSSDMSVATVDSSGLATGSASMAGTITITATSETVDGNAQLTVGP